MEPLGERVKRLRRKLKMTQRDMSKKLGVTPQQVLKYEHGRDGIKIDFMIKLATIFNVTLDYLILGNAYDENSYAVKNIILYLPSLKENKNYNIDKLIQMITFFANFNMPFKTALNKLLFYSDFIHYKLQGDAISSIPYVKLPHGPAPESYHAILGILDGCGVISIKETVVDNKIVEEKIEPLKPFNLEMFTESELDVLRKVSFKLGTMNGAELLETIHNEPFFDKISMGKEIPYKHARSIIAEL